MSRETYYLDTGGGKYYDDIYTMKISKTSQKKNLFIASVFLISLLLMVLISALTSKQNVTYQSKAATQQYNPYTFGYIGCSNTHDTVEGYHAAQGTKNLFWPFISKSAYPIEGQTVLKWANPTDPIWSYFDNMKKTYNAGQDPPIIWVQMCEQLDKSSSNYGQSTYNDVLAMINNIRAHAPTSILYISPLHSYSPIDFCASMGPGGLEQQNDTIPWSNMAVDQWLAQPGPGAKNILNLGPLTVSNTWTDHCHPSGPAHQTQMAGSGELFLGTQLMNFFDNLFINPTNTITPTIPQPPTVNNKLIPSTGAYFGGTGSLLTQEVALGRTLDIQRIYYGWTDQYPDSAVTTALAKGTIPLMSVYPGIRNPGKSITYITWAEIANGSQDSVIRARAQAIKALGKPVMFTFHHEPEDLNHGTSSDFVAAWKHIHDIFVQQGTTNVVWVLITFSSWYVNNRINQYYPGDQYVDWLGPDGYNFFGTWTGQGGCKRAWVTFQSVFQGVVNWNASHGKPILAAEWGTTEDPADPNRKAQWFTDAQALIKSPGWENFKGLVYYNNDNSAVEGCNWKVDSSPTSFDAFKAMALDPYFDPPNPYITITPTTPINPSPTGPAKKKNSFGASMNQAIPLPTRMSTTKQLGTSYYRATAMIVGNNVSFTDDPATINNSGFKIALNVRNYTQQPSKGGTTPESFPQNINTYKTAIASAIDTAKPAIIVVGNEMTLSKMFSGTADQYKQMLTAACDVAKSKKIPCSNDGMLSGSVTYYVYYYYYFIKNDPQKAQNYANIAFEPYQTKDPAAIKTRVENNQIKAYVDTYTAVKPDYVNIHWYVANPEALAETVDVFKTATGLPVITNETNPRSCDPTITTNVMNGIVALNMSYVVWYSTDTQIGSCALQNSDGSLRPNGIAFKNFIANLGITPTLPISPAITQPAGGGTTLSLKLSFQGITSQPASQYNSMAVKVTVAGGLLSSDQIETGTFTADANGIWSGNVYFSSAIPSGSGYRILVKGPKHIQKKICDQTPTETKPGTYHCGKGNISLSSSSNSLDFSGARLLAGDLPDQNGIVDSYDIAQIRNNLGSTDSTLLSEADVNLDGILDSQDFALLIASLSIKTDEE